MVGCFEGMSGFDWGVEGTNVVVGFILMDLALGSKRLEFPRTLSECGFDWVLID